MCGSEIGYKSALCRASVGTGMLPVSGGPGATDLTVGPSCPEDSRDNLLLGRRVSTYFKVVDKWFP
jgi:hypothetical protein